MAKRRKVANLLALAVLSTLAHRPMHPYEMAAAMRGWNKEHDMGIKWGSLYTVVGNLAKHGLIQELESGRQGRRPERTVYQITEAGREELVDWTRELLSVPHTEFPWFRAGLSVMTVLSPDDVAGLLTERLAAIRKGIARLEELYERDSARMPRLFLIEVEYDLAILKAEEDWIGALLGELTAGTFPGLPEWRTFHETGELPAEMKKLAEDHITDI
ncbi:PadR family transcriptional regulator [Microbispora bryophytorum]|uniref:PadR family transcriptional regulator n=1 Tax=Microbispora bryophytorum TaxID=1460882 RepID=A0A8H9H4L9_9ACTN|nr:PadR family transcriptional regulator [Microbispora bryophytorum]MBD3136840.1 PadR family transcriptional regulator [Microbispora bryophytorum]TQS07118.1 PadR family transcriptional regulator [Microbispora bryophytorum]GGO13092.1 PadR family transcriptional regulator [Microbispora bryophytorum]